MKLLLYCTKSEPYLLDLRNDFQNIKFDTFNTKESLKTGWNVLNGKIVGECDYEIEDIHYNLSNNKFTTKTLIHNNLMKLSCLNHIYCENYLLRSIYDYTHNKETIGKAIHIKNLNVFYKPKELSEFYKYNYKDETWSPVNKAPQNMMQVDYINIENNIFLPYILISIHPEWLCKILNGEKKIEIRKVVLKEMENKNV